MHIRLSKNLALGLFHEGPKGNKVYHPTHGPQVWPWWRLLSIKAYRTNADLTWEQAPAYGYNVWLYTRWGALLWHVFADCRTPKQRFAE